MARLAGHRRPTRNTATVMIGSSDTSGSSDSGISIGCVSPFRRPSPARPRAGTGPDAPAPAVAAGGDDRPAPL